MNDSQRNLRPTLVLLSPLVIILLGQIIARIAGVYLGQWTWLPLAWFMWIMFALMIFWSGGWESIRRWLSKPKGSAAWPALALVIGLIPLPLFLRNWQLFSLPWLIVLWVIFALINTPLEEGYWRGVLIDRTSHWPAWVGVFYSSFFFAINHPLTYGVFSAGNRHPITIISTFVMGLIWAIVYRKTGSLRWVIAAHVLVDLFNLSILAFLNIYVPPNLPGM